MTAKTPGQATCETWQTCRLGVDRTSPWEALSQKARADWEAAAQAAIDWWHAERDLEPPRTITVPAPELAAAMAETRGMREKLAAEAARLDAAAAKAEKARDGSRDGTYRMMLDQRAEWCREQAAVLRGIAGIGDGQ